jgi:hypothetical protein
VVLHQNTLGPLGLIGLHALWWWSLSKKAKPRAQDFSTPSIGIPLISWAGGTGARSLVGVLG